MKISRKLLILSLVLVLGVVSFIPSTFSWYDHDDVLTGNQMKYHREGLPVSAGNVTMETKKFRTENNKLWYDEKGNKQYGDVITAGSVSIGQTQYYGTILTNTGTAPAYVNLYLKDFKHEVGNEIGTLQPSLTQKGVSSTVHLANYNVIRVYFQWDQASGWSANGAKTYVVYTTKSSMGAIQMTNHITQASSGSTLLNTQQSILGNKIEQTYYADLPKDTVEFFFASDGNKSKFNTQTYVASEAWYRTKTISNVQPETGYYLTGVSDDTTFNAQYGSFHIQGGVSVKTYYDTIMFNKSQRTYINLSGATNYTGASVSYATTDTDKISVNTNTGEVIAASDLQHGTNLATITTTITGSLGDTTTVSTKINNPTTVDTATVTLNVEVPGKSQDEKGNWVNGTAEIVWYIKNGSTQPCTFNGIQFTE